MSALQPSCAKTPYAHFQIISNPLFTQFTHEAAVGGLFSASCTMAALFFPPRSNLERIWFVWFAFFRFSPTRSETVQLTCVSKAVHRVLMFMFTPIFPHGQRVSTN